MPRWGETLARLVDRRIAAPVANTAAITAIPASRRVDGQQIIETTNGGVWWFDADSAVPAGPSVLVPDAGSGRWLAAGGGGMPPGVGTVNISEVRVATTVALAAYTRVGNVITADANGALAAIDGVTLVLNDRLLLQDGAAGADNGPYQVTQVGTGALPYILTRVGDADASAEVTAGMLHYASEGTLNGNEWFFLTTNDPITLNTTALTYAQVPSLVDLASVANGLGASLIGVEDAAGVLGGPANVELGLSAMFSLSTSADLSLTTRLSTEESTSLSADTSQDLVTSANLSTSTSAELSLTTRLSTEESTSLSADTSQDLVTSANLSTSTSAELSLTTRLSTEESTSLSADTSQDLVTSANLSTSTSAELSLTTRLSTEESTSLSADTSQDLVTSANLSTSTSAELSLTTRLSTEESTSLSADTSQDTRVGAIETTLDGNTPFQTAGGTFAAGTATIAAGITVTANTDAFVIMSAVVTGSTNVGCLAHLKASNVVGGAGVGAVTLNILGNDGNVDGDAAGAFRVLLVN